MEELEKRWDILEGTDTDELASADFNPEVGWCDAANATASFMIVAENRGAQRVTGEVSSILLDDQNGSTEGVQSTDGRRLTAGKVVPAIGAWMSRLLSRVEDALSISEYDRIER